MWLSLWGACHPDEVELVSTVPVVTATTGTVRQLFFSGSGRWGTVLSRKSRISDEFMFIPQVRWVRRSGSHRFEAHG